MFRHILRAVAVVAVAAGFALPASAQLGGNKGTTMIIGFGPGGGYDLWGRTVARFIGKHLPGTPNVVVQNMPGAGSYVAASWMYNIAPKDGSVMAIIARDAVLGPLTGAEGARFDPLKLNWLGTPTTETNVCIVNNNAQVQSVEDLYTKTLIVGDTGPGTGTRSYPNALTALLGMKFKLVSGFPSSSDVFLAMERGEVDGICESLDSVTGKRPDWLPTKKVKILFQGGAEPNPHVDAPFILDIAKTEEQKAAIKFLYAGQGIGRPFVAPPNMPADKLKILREAFDKTRKDPEFIAEAKKSKLDVEPEDGEHLAKLIKEIYATPKDSGMKFNVDFFAGYSPERINPGDKQRRLTNIVKITSGSTPETADFVDSLYRSILTVETHKAPSIKVAEAAKVIENTQRDVNIALMNELAMIFSRMGIDTLEVLEAAGSKWNFLPFRPGLVGGHCIGVDPYYLSFKAQQVGYYPELISAQRRVNDRMGQFVVDETVKLMLKKKITVCGARVLVLGITFKENCPDVRNTRVVDIVHSFNEYGCIVDVYDPWAGAGEVKHEYGIELTPQPAPSAYDAVVAAVKHQQFSSMTEVQVRALCKEKAVIYDIKRVLSRDIVDAAL